MEQSQEITELTAALIALQAEIKPVKMDSENPFYHSKYASLHSVWEQTRPLLKKHGLAVIQAPDTHEGQVGVSTTIAHESGQWIKAFFGMTPAKQDPQELGKIVTYFRRYALGGFLGIVTEEDTDGEVGQHKPEKKDPVPVGGKDTLIAPAVIKKFQALKKSLKAIDEKKGEERYYAILGAVGGVTHANEITKTNSDKVAKALQDAIPQLNEEMKNTQ